MPPRPRSISSAANDEFKKFKSLLKSRGITEHNQALVSGKRFIEEILELHRPVARGIISFDGFPDDPNEVADDLPLTILSKALFDELDEFGTKYPLLLVDVPEFAPFDADAPWPEGLTIFLPLQNPDNVGAVIRSAAAFNAARVVILKEGAHPFLPKALRAAGPSVFTTRIETGDSLSKLWSGPMQLYALDTDGASLETVKLPKRAGVVIGMEGSGLKEINPSLSIIKLTIPMNPKVESLNAAVATSILLFWNSLE